MKKVIGIACFILFALAGNAQNLKGTWVLDSGTQQAVESKTANVKTMKVVKSTPTLASGTPQTMSFEEGNFSFIYADGSVLQGGYFIKNDTIKLGTAAESAEYKIVEQNDKLTIEMGNKEQLSFSKKE